VWIPRLSSRSCVRGPTPHSAPIGSGVRNSISVPAAISVSPSGLFMPLAIFARNFTLEIPTEQVSEVSARTAARIASAA
jgi:hypothetical protein